jgi:hypothetical protein
MRPEASRYLVPVAALFVTFVAGGLLFFTVFTLTDSSDEGVAFEAAATVTSTPTPSPTTELPSPAATSTTVPGPAATAPTATSSPTTAPTAAPTNTPTAVPTVAPTAQPPATPVATAIPPASFAGSWRIVDRILGGQGAGETYAFFVSIAQTGAELRGGAPGAIEFSGTVAGNIATVQFSQPTLGVTGIFIWTLGADGSASGTFTSSIPNSGTSELVRLQ